MEKQVEKIIELTEKGLTQMAEGLNVTIPQLWEILVKQQYVEAIQAFAAFGLCLIVWGILYKKNKGIREWLKQREDEDDNSERLVPIVVLIVLLSFVTIVSSVGMTEGIGKIINPEYYAIKDIVGFIGEIKGGE